MLHRLAKTYRLGVVTNCSQRLGRIAAKRVGVEFDVVVTARVEVDTYWHNRVGLKRPEGTPPPLREERTPEKLFHDFE